MELSEQTLGEIVSGDFRTAAIFSESGLDFCCGGNVSLSVACRNKGVDIVKVEEKIKMIEDEPVIPGQNFNEWKLDFLCDYIVNTHHVFVKKSLPGLLAYTVKIASVHAENHPELKEVERLFAKIAGELTQHLKNEEEVLFPAIRQSVSVTSDDTRSLIISEISRMNGEHESAGGAMDRINAITDGYRVPADGCSTYQVTFKLLRQFEDDLHIHVHLENNILFRKALSIT
ncbi:MAG TPA: iron-sulfur cluster repair di-iron protein [Bacteroidales bacterium]|nr:iron-sulfur cluster repair di-iron protein [Bacteroidales bacterium]